MAVVLLTCEQCKVEFPRPIKAHNQNIKRGFVRSYCSPACKGASRATGVHTSCTACGKPIYRNTAQANKSKSGKHYCSHSCSQTTNNIGNRYSYKHGMDLYRNMALCHYGRACTVCGYDVEKVLEVHHRDSNRKHNKIENLDVLCPTHHKEYQLGIRKYGPVAEQ